MEQIHEVHDSTTAFVERELKREIAEVETAIALVRAGAASVVSVANLRFGEEVLEQIRADHGDWGILLKPLPWPEDSGCDIEVRRVDSRPRSHA